MNASNLLQRFHDVVRSLCATGEGKFFNLKVAHPTGIEPKSAKNSDDAEEPDVIDISKLKKVDQ
jgi:hypothetical protein